MYVCSLKVGMPREVPWHVLIRTRTTIISAFAFFTPFYADPKLTTGLITVHTYIFDATYPYLRICIYPV